MNETVNVNYNSNGDRIAYDLLWLMTCDYIHQPERLWEFAAWWSGVFAINCDDILLPKILTSRQLLLIGLGINPYSIEFLSNFQLDVRRAKTFCKQDDFLIFNNQYINIDIFKEHIDISKPFISPVNIIDILLKSPRVNAVLNIINAEFPEKNIETEDGLILLLNLAKNNEKYMNRFDLDLFSGGNILFINILSNEVTNLLNKLKKISNNEEKARAYARKLCKFLSQNHSDLLASGIKSTVAKLIKDKMLTSININTILKYIGGIFPENGTSNNSSKKNGDKLKKNAEDSIYKKLIEIHESIDFNIFY